MGVRSYGWRSIAGESDGWRCTRNGDRTLRRQRRTTLGLGGGPGWSSIRRRCFRRSHGVYLRDRNGTHGLSRQKVLQSPLLTTLNGQGSQLPLTSRRPRGPEESRYESSHLGRPSVNPVSVGNVLPCYCGVFHLPERVPVCQ